VTDETPTKRVLRDKRSGKTFLREQRLVAPHAVKVKVVHFDDETRSKLLGLLTAVRPRTQAKPPTVLNEELCEQLDAMVQNGIDRHEAALSAASDIASTFTRQSDQGWSQSPAPKQETRRALNRVRRLLTKIANEPDESHSTICDLMNEIRPDSELEMRLVRAGWGWTWEDQLLTNTAALSRAVEPALKKLRGEKRDAGAPVQWAERAAYYSLATVWWWGTGRPVSTGQDDDLTPRCAFAEFAETILAATSTNTGHRRTPLGGHKMARLLKALV
jgi:hypothetical protein